MALGLNPLVPGDEPIDLLRRLVPEEEIPTEIKKFYGREFYQDKAGFLKMLCSLPPADREYDRQPKPGPWLDFLILLGRELDLDLSFLGDCEERYFTLSRDLGRLISNIQRHLEGARETQNVLTVVEFDSHRLKSFEQLAKEYADQRNNEAYLNGFEMDLEKVKESNTIRFLAFSLGDPVGFIEAHRYIKSADQAHALGHELGEITSCSIEVDHLHVTGYMRNTGVSRRLIRRIVEQANEQLCREVWLETSRFQREDLPKFRRAGFSESEMGRFLSLEMKQANPIVRAFKEP
jgi:GNAT superfamily N-acetyltransferase